MVPSDILSRIRLKTWAEARPAGSIVGFAESDFRCPLACYLNDVREPSGNDGWEVSHTRAVLYSEQHPGESADVIVLSAFSVALIEAIDALGELTPVTREEFLRRLAMVEVHAHAAS